MSTFHVDVVLTVWCESIRRGCTFVARITDGSVDRFYSGQGATAFEAIAWALDEYVRRAILGRPRAMSRGYSEQPGDTLLLLPDTSSREADRSPPAPPSESASQVAAGVSTLAPAESRKPAPSGNDSVDQTFARAADVPAVLELTLPTIAQRAPKPKRKAARR